MSAIGLKPNAKSIGYLREHVERARRLADAMTSTADRDQLHAAADEYKRQIDVASDVPVVADAPATDMAARETGQPKID